MALYATRSGVAFEVSAAIAVLAMVPIDDKIHPMATRRRVVVKQYPFIGPPGGAQ
jgi:hypothetical protein